MKAQRQQPESPARLIGDLGHWAYRGPSSVSRSGPAEGFMEPEGKRSRLDLIFPEDGLDTRFEQCVSWLPRIPRALCLALRHAHRKSVERILDQGFDPLVPDNRGVIRMVRKAVIMSREMWVIDMALELGWIDLEETYAIGDYEPSQSPLEFAVSKRLHSKRISDLLHRTKSATARTAALGRAFFYGVPSAVRAFLADRLDLDEIFVRGHSPLCFHTKHLADEEYVRLLLSNGARLEACQCAREQPYWYPTIHSDDPSRMAAVSLILAEMVELRMDIVLRYTRSHETRARLVELLDQNITIQQITRVPSERVAYTWDLRSREAILAIAKRNRQIRARIVAACVALLAARRFRGFAVGLDVRILRSILRDRVWPTRRDADVWLRIIK